MHILADIRLDEEVAHGSFGTVWRGRTSTGIAVAVKVVRGSHAASLLLETKVAAGLAHPHVVRLLDAGVIGVHQSSLAPPGSPYLVLEWAAGGTLADGTLAPQERHEALTHVLRGLAHLHGRGLVHGDIKPSNVLRMQDEVERWVLADFGISRPAGEVHVGGTLPFMAPERFSTAPASVAADLYAVGVLGWWLVTGRRPREGTSPMSWAIAHHEPAPEAQAGSPRMDAWLRTLLSVDPAERFFSAADALFHLPAPHDQALPAPLVAESHTLTVPTGSPWASAPVRPSAAPSLAPRRPFPEADEALCTAWPRRVWSGPSVARYRRPPVVGRVDEQRRLWLSLEACQTRGMRVCIESGAGMGCRTLAGWLVERAAELGAAVSVGPGPWVDATGNLDDLVDGFLLRWPHLDPEHAWTLATNAVGGMVAGAAWGRAVKELGQGRPVIVRMSVDDDATPRWLWQMRTPGILVLVTARREVGVTWDEHLLLQGLSASDVGAIVSAVVPLEEADLARIEATCEGNPGHAVAMALAVHEGRVGSADQAEDAWVRAMAVAASHGGPDLLVRGVLLGARVQEALWQALSPQAPALLEALRSEGLLSGRPPRLATLLLQAVHTHAGPLAAHHAALLGLPMSMDRWARHARQAGRVEDARAAFLEAAEAASDAYQSAPALSLADEGLALCNDDDARRVPFQLVRAHALMSRVDVEGSHAAATRALALAVEPAHKATALRRLSVVAMRRGDLEEAAEHLLMALLHAVDEQTVLLTSELISFRLRQGRIDEAGDLLRSMRVEGAPLAARHAAHSVAAQWHRRVGNLQAAHAEVDRALRECTDLRWRGILGNQKGDLLRMGGDLESAEKAYAVAGDAMLRCGAMQERCFALLNQAMLAAKLGRANDAYAPLAVVLRHAKDHGVRSLDVYGRAVHAWARSLQGHSVREALEELSRLVNAHPWVDPDLAEVLRQVAQHAPDCAELIDAMLVQVAPPSAG